MLSVVLQKLDFFTKKAETEIFYSAATRAGTWIERCGIRSQAGIAKHFMMMRYYVPRSIFLVYYTRGVRDKIREKTRAWELPWFLRHFLDRLNSTFFSPQFCKPFSLSLSLFCFHMIIVIFLFSPLSPPHTLLHKSLR